MSDPIVEIMEICNICHKPVALVEAHIGKEFDSKTGFAGRWVYSHEECYQQEREK
jgi:hypothetical protein